MTSDWAGLRGLIGGSYFRHVRRVSKVLEKIPGLTIRPATVIEVDLLGDYPGIQLAFICRVKPLSALQMQTLRHTIQPARWLHNRTFVIVSDETPSNQMKEVAREIHFSAVGIEELASWFESVVASMGEESH